MNKEQLKAEIRFYKRFLDELEGAMQRRTTLGALKEVAKRFGIPTWVINDLIRFGAIHIEGMPHIGFDVELFREDVETYFSLSDEPDYEIADGLRIACDNIQLVKDYVQSGRQEQILIELELEDEQLSPKCEQCYYPLPNKRSDARFCCDACRKRASSSRSSNEKITNAENEKSERRFLLFLFGN